MALLISLNEKAFKFGDDKISPSDRGVGRLEMEALLLSLYDGMVREERAEERLVLLVFFETPAVNSRNERLIVSPITRRLTIYNEGNPKFRIHRKYPFSKQTNNPMSR